MRNRTRGFTLIEILVVITIIAALAGAVMVLVPKIQEQQEKASCAGHLSQFGALYQTETLERGGGRPRHNGVAYFLHFRHGAKRAIAKGQEEIFTCPGDSTVVIPKTDEERSAYDDVDLKDPSEDLCSYVVRDFKGSPIGAEDGELQAIAADRQTTDHRTAHHKGGLNVLFQDTSVKFLDREALGLSGDDDIVVGPDAANDMLRTLIYGEPNKE